MECRFSDKRSDYDRNQDIAEWKQRPGELLDDYFAAIRKSSLLARVYNTVDQCWILRIIKRNLSKPVKQWV